MDSIKPKARLAAALYLLVVLTAPFGLMVVPGRLFDPGSAAVTADHLRASESLLRWGMASELFHQAVEVYLVLALYELFKVVEGVRARRLVLLGLVPIPIMFLNVLNEVGALLLVKGAPLVTAFSRPQADALAWLFIRLHSHGIQVAAVFWGLWLFPLGGLIRRSGFLPPLLGWLVMASGLGYLLGSSAYLLAPRLSPRLDLVTFVLQLGEPLFVLWLAIASVRPGWAPVSPDR